MLVVDIYRVTEIGTMCVLIKDDIEYVIRVDDLPLSVMCEKVKSITVQSDLLIINI